MSKGGEAERAAPRPRLRWWPAASILALAGGGLSWVWFFGDKIRQQRTVETAGILVLTGLALLLWMLLASRLRWRTRLVCLAALALTALLGGALFQVEGVTGDLVPILTFRWSGTGDSLAARTDPSADAPAGDYPQFLGPNRDAVLPESRFETDWEKSPPRLLWRRAVGAGWSSFAVRGDLAVTQEQQGDRELVVGYDLRTGKVRWTHSDPGRYENVIAGTGPRATPTISDGKVYTAGAGGLLNCLDLATGASIWRRDVMAENDASPPNWGYSCSPLVVGNLVVVSVGGKARSLAAYDKNTGQPVWRGGDDGGGYSSPQLRTVAGVPQILIFNHASVAGHDPVDGRVLWQFPWPPHQPNVSQPLPLPGDQVFVSSGYGVGGKLLQIAGVDGKLQAELIYSTPRMKAKFSNLIYHDGFIYGLDDGVMVCLDPATGKRRWKKGRYGHGQILLAGGHLLVSTETGDIVLVRPNPKDLEELGRFSAVSGKTWNPPALAGRLLLVRNHKEASCWELPPPTK